MTKIKDVTSFLEDLAPTPYQEHYDNAGLLTGDSDSNVRGILICLDVTEAIIDEAIQKKCNLVIAHHPIIFRGLKQLTGRNYVERTIIKAIKNDVSIYAIHTNLDNVKGGVNQKIAEKIGLEDPGILSPKKDTLSKLVTFVPPENTEELIAVLSNAGAGRIGNYSKCSFKVSGKGTFEPNEEADPHIGKKGRLEEVDENRIEMIFPSHISGQVISVLKESHPYEEVAYYLSKVENPDGVVGSGMIGSLQKEMNSNEFLKHLKSVMELECIKYTNTTDTIKKVAICGGAGSFLLPVAIKKGADAFVSSDFKYHEYFDAENKILVADIGHYESEKFTKELIYELLSEKFNSFAVNLSDTNTNPVNYFV